MLILSTDLQGEIFRATAEADTFPQAVFPNILPSMQCQQPGV